MAKNTGKVREFCQSGKVGTLLIKRSSAFAERVQSRCLSTTKFFNVFDLFVVTSSSSAGSINNNSGVNTGSAGDGDTQQYWERLKILRARCGLENTGEKTDGTSEPNRTVAALQQQGVRLTDSSSSLSSNSSGGLVRFHSRLPL